MEYSEIACFNRKTAFIEDLPFRNSDCYSTAIFYIRGFNLDTSISDNTLYTLFNNNIPL